MICKNCKNEDCTWHFHPDHISDGCLGFERMTNADRIRNMSDEELAEYLFDRGNCQEYCYGICDVQDECNGSPSDAYCISHIVKWLKKEVEDG